jgi:hypothetical protein
LGVGHWALGNAKGQAGLTNTFDLNFSELLAVAVLHLIAFSSFLFKDNNLIALYVFQDLT